MRVFTDEFVTWLKKKYINKPNNEKVLIYSIATKEIYAKRRESIELWLNLISEANKYKNQLIKNLQSIENYQHESAYNELLVGVSLKKQHLNIEYSPTLTSISKDPLTPDWLVLNEDGSQAFYAEVFTPNPPNDRTKNEDNWEDLCRRIKKTSNGYGIKIQTEKDISAPDPSQQKKIAEKVKAWIDQYSPKLQEKLYLDYATLQEVSEDKIHDINWIRFEIIEYLVNDTWCSPPSHMYKIESDWLVKNIKYKVKKYMFAEELQNKPFLLFLVPGTLSLYNHRDIEEILYGRTGFRVSDSRILNLEDGLYTGKNPISPILSAVVWLHWYSTTYVTNPNENFHHSPTLYPNPNAKNPIPEEWITFVS